MRTASSAEQKNASTAENARESSFVSICGQFSNGRSSNPKSKKNITGDGAFGKDRGENRFWAVATPLRAAWQPPNAFGAGGRYRPMCPAEFLAPSPAEF